MVRKVHRSRRGITFSVHQTISKYLPVKELRAIVAAEVSALPAWWYLSKLTEIGFRVIGRVFLVML